MNKISASSDHVICITRRSEKCQEFPPSSFTGDLIQMDSELLVLPREDPDWQKALDNVNDDSDNLELWEVLIELTERIQQAASKKIHVQYNNSKRKQQEFPEVYTAIKQTTRTTYDRFLEKFVLLFGYWIKYAELEIQFAKEQGDESGGLESADAGAQRVYERAVAAFPMSVDLWVSYLGFMVSNYNKTSGMVSVNALRTLFERGVELVGKDFLSHPLWDMYIEFEESLGGDDLDNRLVRILARTVQNPLHQYARYYEKFSGLLSKYTGSHEELIALAPIPSPPGEDVATHYTRIFQRTQQGTTDRWAYESRISRSYFHVVELEQDQIENWHAYLTWEEAQGDFEQTRTLYERALVPGALYDTFWLRYVRWMLKVARGIPAKKNQIIEETRNIFRRAATIFVPVARPFIRYQFALFEESQGEIMAARDIIQAMQKQYPESEEPLSYRIDLERRVGGVEAAIAFTEALLKTNKSAKAAVAATEDLTVTSPNIRAYLIASQAKLYTRLPKKDTLKARSLFKQNANKCWSSKFFWVSYFEFEVSEAQALLRKLNANNTKDEIAIQREYQTFVQTYLDPLWSNLIASKAHLPPYLIADLSRIYADFLATSGMGPATPWAARTAFVDIDMEVNGSLVNRTRLLTKLADYGGSPAASLQRLKNENGHPGVEINPLQKQPQQTNNDNEQAFHRYFQAQGGLSTY